MIDKKGILAVLLSSASNHHHPEDGDRKQHLSSSASVSRVEITPASGGLYLSPVGGTKGGCSRPLLTKNVRYRTPWLNLKKCSFPSNRYLY